MTRRSHVGAGLAAVSVITMAAGIFYLRGGSTPVDVKDAIDRFRTTTLSSASDAPKRRLTQRATPAPQRTTTRTATERPQTATTRPRSNGRPQPPEGVYVYATDGGDEVDVLGGSRHEYPAETTVTVRHAGCGLIERWDVLDERWDERETCRTAKGDALKRFTSFHEFFRHADERRYDCNAMAYPAGAQPGDTWKGKCVSGESVVEQTGRAIAFETVIVDGVRVSALHVRVDVKLTGEQEGAGYREVWGDRATGLSLRERGTTTSYSIQPVFGRTRYHEKFEIRLKSLDPRR